MGHSSAYEVILSRFTELRVVVLGDVILDRYWWGECSRLSPEAPVPVVRRKRSSVTPGGAANTAANLSALGAAVDLIGVTGADAAAEELKGALNACGVRSYRLMKLAGRPTTTKTRIVALHQHVVRVDDEETGPVSQACVEETLACLAELLPAAAAVVVSDYAKGFLSPALLKRVIVRAREAGKPVFVDPKAMDCAPYRGCTLIKPNRSELSLLAGMPVRNREETSQAARRLVEDMGESLVLVTEGQEGMTLFSARGEEHVEAPVRQVYDVTGAGDTVLAAVALSLCAGASHREAMEIASHAASIVIGRIGTAVAGREELALSLTPR